MNARGHAVDKTFLSLDQAEERGFIHRDYIAHCHRWSHVMKCMYERKRYVTARILDVGCGRELPLAKTLYSQKLSPAAYFGVDVGKILDESMAFFKTDKFPLKVFENTDVLTIEKGDLGDAPVDIITMFEVAEHVEPKHLMRILNHLGALATTDCLFFLSTPCWNRIDCADNHVNEITYEAMGSVLEGNGWDVVRHYGTFASIRDYEHLLKDHPMWGDMEKVFWGLRQYYDTNVLSTILAPLFPQASRNVLWVCQPRTENSARRFPLIQECGTPWSSSHLWRDFDTNAITIAHEAKIQEHAADDSAEAGEECPEQAKE